MNVSRKLRYIDAALGNDVRENQIKENERAELFHEQNSTQVPSKDFSDWALSLD